MNEATDTFSGQAFPRILGDWSVGTPGPLVVICGGIHGNEPAGVFAAQRVLHALQRNEVPIRGRCVAFAGNLRALAAGQRFIERDLNRSWSEAWFRRGSVDAKDATSPNAEDAEQAELARLIQETLVADNWPSVVFLDLHSFSAEGHAFAIMADTLRNRDLAWSIPIPTILGFEESVEGTLLEYFAEQGHVAIAIEGGQHSDPNSVRCHEAALWISLVRSGCVDERHVPNFPQYREFLERLSEGQPRFLEVCFRHGLHPEDGFVMNPGYTNFQPVEKDEVLATDRRGKVHAPVEGRILMPLYQEQGEDGFFIGKPIRWFWLQLSAVLRRMRLELLLIPVLPGVHRLPNRNHWVYVNPKIARWFVVEIFHLLGFRRQQARHGAHVFSRRPPP